MLDNEEEKKQQNRDYMFDIDNVESREDDMSSISPFTKEKSLGK